MDLWALSFNGSYQNASKARFQSNIWIKMAITSITISCKKSRPFVSRLCTTTTYNKSFTEWHNLCLSFKIAQQQQKVPSFFLRCFCSLHWYIDKVGCTHARLPHYWRKIVTSVSMKFQSQYFKSDHDNANHYSDAPATTTTKTHWMSERKKKSTQIKLEKLTW